MYLLSHQYDFVNMILESLNNHNYAVVTGNSGCGKSFSFRWMCENIATCNYEKILILDSDYFNEEQDYFPFKKALYSKENIGEHYVKQGAVEVAKDTPLVGNFVSFIVGSILKTNTLNNVDVFNDEERIIINYIKKELRNKKSFVICDNIHWWDRRSLNLLMNLINFNILPSNIKFVFSLTCNQEGENNKLIEKLLNVIDTELLKFPVLSYMQFKKYLLAETQHSLSEKQIELLYNLVDGHLKVFFEVVKEIKENSFDFSSSFESNVTYLKSLLNRRLKECGASGKQIIEILEYASIIGICFSEFELYKLTDYTKSKIKDIIEKSKQLKLTENNYDTEDYRFAHDIIREIFKMRVDESHIDYYRKMSLCVKEIKPSQYHRRAKYMALSKNNAEAEILFCLEMIAQLRVYGNISETLLEETKYILNDSHKKYIDLMSKAYNAYHKKSYDLTLRFLNLILGCYSCELIAERDILKLGCYSKKLASDEIALEIDKLNEKRTLCLENNEKEIFERYTHALITAYSHLGQILIAKELEEEVLMSLGKRIDFDKGAKNRLHTIMRNANAIHGIDTSIVFVKQARDFFGKINENGEYSDIKQYYTSLINYSAVLIMQGEFTKAYNETIKAFNLEKENGDIVFPRPQILRNNFIISGVFDGQIIPSDAIDMYKDILTRLPGILAEKIFYTSNLSIMYAINNQPDIALHLLINETRNHNVMSDKEGLYKYRVETNCAIFQYLIGNHEGALIKLHQQENCLNRLINGSYFQKKNDVMIDIMESSQIYDGNSWLSAVHAKCPEFQGKPWRYFGKGYAFAALCDWGI